MTLAVSYGGGTNSTAMLCGFVDKAVKPDLILFADTGAEMPHTYDHVAFMQTKVQEWWSMEIVVVRVPNLTIIDHCEKTHMLPSLAYGHRSCSQKFKHEPMEDYIKAWATAKVSEFTKAIGYGADEGHRVNGKPLTKQLRVGLTETYWYPLVDWQWRREECMAAICRHGIPQPGKSACFFCPASKRSEVLRLAKNHPELMKKALEIENAAQARHRTVVGLGGIGNLWVDWLSMDEAQGKLMLDIEPVHMPCHCTD